MVYALFCRKFNFFLAVSLVDFGLASWLLAPVDYNCVWALVLISLFYVAFKKVQVLAFFVNLGFDGWPVKRVLTTLFNVDVARLLLNQGGLVGNICEGTLRNFVVPDFLFFSRVGVGFLAAVLHCLAHGRSYVDSKFSYNLRITWNFRLRSMTGLWIWWRG